MNALPKLVTVLAIILLLISCKSQSTSKNSSQIITHLGNPVLNQRIWSIYQDSKENFWFGSNGNGVYVYNGKELQQFRESDGLVDDQIRDIQEDKNGNIFIATPDGVSKYDGKNFTTLEVISSPNNTWELNDDDLWFNCNGNAEDIFRYDGEKLYELKLPRKDLNKAFNTEVQGLSFPGMSQSPYSVFGIDKDKSGNLWIGTIVAGAYRYDGNSFLWFPEKELTTLPDGRVPGVRSMIEDKEGNIWLSNFISKYKVLENGDSVTYEKLQGVDMMKRHFDDSLPYFNGGLTDKDGILWMVTYGDGVWKYDGEDLINFPIVDPDIDVLLVSIFQDKDGLFWLGSDNAGVYTFDGLRFEKFTPITLDIKNDE